MMQRIFKPMPEAGSQFTRIKGVSVYYFRITKRGGRNTVFYKAPALFKSQFLKDMVPVFKVVFFKLSIIGIQSLLAFKAIADNHQGVHRLCFFRNLRLIIAHGISS